MLISKRTFGFGEGLGICLILFALSGGGERRLEIQLLFDEIF